MTYEDRVQLFCLKCSILTRELNQQKSRYLVQEQRSDLERYTDELVDSHLAQIDLRIQRDALKMGEFYRMFYAVENDIRQTISTTLDAAHGSGWWEAKVPPAVKDNVKKLRDREETEGVPP